MINTGLLKILLTLPLKKVFSGLPTGAPECVDNPAHYGTSAQVRHTFRKHEFKLSENMNLNFQET